VLQSLVGPFAPDPERQGLIDQSVARWTRGPRVVQVVYVVATATAPDDLLEAYAQLVGHWYRRVKTQSGGELSKRGRSRKFGDAWTTFLPGAVAGLPLPPDVERLLAPLPRAQPLTRREADHDDPQQPADDDMRHLPPVRGRLADHQRRRLPAGVVPGARAGAATSPRTTSTGRTTST